MELISQNPDRPSSILYAISSIADSDTSQFRAAVAYVTRRGVDTLMDRLSHNIGGQWSSIPKTVVTSFDFGHTEPAALRELLSIPAMTIRVANQGSGTSVHPGRTNYHPKVFIFDKATEADVLVGSANLTMRALTVNTEAALVGSMERSVIDPVWTDLAAGSVMIDDELIDAYDSVRAVSPPPSQDQPLVLVSPSTGGENLPNFWDEIASGAVDPADYEVMWIEAGSMSSGGSHNQLELPRGANRFFGFEFTDYDDSQTTIGFPTLTTGSVQWADRPLTWHGNNRMERMNLPTLLHGGFHYPGTAIAFRRHPNGFEVMVANWDTDLAVTWRNASTSSNRVFRIGGGRNTRTCGLF